MIEQEIALFKQIEREKGRQGLVLDIDETLSWTVAHWMKEMQERFGNPEGLSVEEMVARYRFSYNVPYWQTDEAMAWLEEARHQNELQESLPVIEGANETARAINEIVPIVGYLTIRPHVVIPGTRSWLEKHDFPEGIIIAKPDGITHAEGNRWKAEVLRFLFPEVIGIIDDNPDLLEYLTPDYEGEVYLFGSETIDSTGLRVIPCKTWSNVYEQVKAIHGQIVE